jgi:excisionase family DNA binding protein
MLSDYPDIITVDQLADILGVGKNKAYELVNSHVIGSRRIGRRILIPKVCLIDFIESIRYTDIV